MPQGFSSVLSAYADDLQRAFDLPPNAAAWPEEQLKTPVGELIETGAAVLGITDVRTLKEVRAEAIGRPDIGVTVDGLLIGHVELKKPGKGANPNRFGGRDRAQWRRFKDLPNLLYTDGSEWAHFQNGERVGPLVRLSGDVVADGATAITERDTENLFALFREFLRWHPIVPARPKALAKLLAPVCRLLRSDVEAALENADSPLSHLAGDWRRYFFPDATSHQFADAYAQTLTYALLLARFSGADDLDIPDAAGAIRSGHRLLAETLKVLGDRRAREQVATSLDVLERHPTAADLVNRILDGETFNASAFPSPTAEERRGPVAAPSPKDLPLFIDAD